jgi:hypothetical protein
VGIVVNVTWGQFGSPEERNVCRWKPLPEDVAKTLQAEEQMRGAINFEVSEIPIAL